MLSLVKSCFKEEYVYGYIDRNIKNNWLEKLIYKKIGNCGNIWYLVDYGFVCYYIFWKFKLNKIKLVKFFSYFYVEIYFLFFFIMV